MTALEALTRIRWAEATIAAMKAESVIAHYASLEAQLAAAEDRANISSGSGRAPLPC